MKPATTTLIAEHAADRIAIRRSNHHSPIMVQHAATNARPFIHPIIAPDGNGTLTENAPPHHPWQHGLYVGLNEVNGVGFWTEGLRQSPTDGTFHPRPMATAKVEGSRCSWAVVCDWRAPNGQALLAETQAWTLYDRGNSYDLDLQWTLTASVDLTFGKYAYGGLFVRMPFVSQGTVINSEGLQTPTKTEAQRARWVAIAMPIPDRTGNDPIAGIAMMDHPSNPEHPVPWRVDGQLGISPSRCIVDAWRLKTGASSVARHRVFIHTGATDVAAVESSWSRFIH
jgi:hypothetical protein